MAAKSLQQPESPSFPAKLIVYPLCMHVDSYSYRYNCKHKHVHR